MQRGASTGCSSAVATASITSRSPNNTRALSIQVESDNALKSLILSMILSEKSATFRDHARSNRVGSDREHGRDLVDQSGLAPDDLTTLPHLSVSSAMIFAKSAGEPASAVPPMSAS